MLVVLELAAILALLGTVAVATGWTMARLAAIRRLQSSRIEAVSASALTGTAVWVLAAAWSSYLGWSIQQARWPLAGVWLLLVVLALGRRRPRLSPRSWRDGPVILCMAASGLATAFIFWPLAYCASAWPFNDTLTYCTLSAWLQEHGFGTSVAPIDPERPLTWLVWQFQYEQWRMGSTFFLALIQGYSGLDALLAFPIAMAWGMLLNLAGIFLVARWALRLNRWFSAGACFAAAAALNPLHTAIQQGFQPQLFGTAFLGASLAILARTTRPSFWSRPHAFLLGLVVCALLSVYSEMAPILGLVGAGYVGMTSFRAWRIGRLRQFARFACWTLFWLLLLGNYEWLRAAHAVRQAVGVVVGFPIRWSDREFLGFALGQLHFNHRPELGARRLAMILAAGLLLVIGVRRLWRDRRAAVVGMALAVFAAMAVYFRLVAADPRTGETGNPWSLYKLCKWSFPLLLAAQFAGLSLLLRRLPRRAWLTSVPGLIVLAASFTPHREHILWAGRTTRAMTGSAAPLEEWQRLNAELDRLGPGRIYLLRGDDERVPQILVPYALRSRRFANGWKGCDMEGACSADPARPDANTIVLMCGVPPFEADFQSLPGNLTRLDSSRPHLFHLENAGDGQNGTGPLTCWVWSPRAGRLRLTARERTAGLHEMLVEGPQERAPLRPVDGGRFEATLSLPSGRSRLRIVSESPVKGSSSRIVLERISVDLIADDTLGPPRSPVVSSSVGDR